MSNTKKIAISEKYDAIPRKYTIIKNLPSQLKEYADSNNIETQSIDLDGDNNCEYVVAYSSYASPEDYDIEKYTNYSEILIFDNNFNKIATLVTAKDQYWENNGTVTDEFFCSLADVEYIDIDNDNIMEILVDTHIYEGIGVNIYKYEKGNIKGNTDYALSVLP